MKLRYYSDFKSVKNNTYRLEIHTALSAYAEPITLSSAPLVAEYESNALYQPLKMSNATISVLANRILTDLYTGENQGVEVRLYNQTDDILEWFGYLTPNLYSSEYISAFDNVELEAIDTLANLDNIKYSYIEDNGTFRSFSDVLFFVLDKADPKRVLNKVYIQKTNRISKESLLCLFDESYIHERNFFDESNEPATCQDVLKSLAQYYGMTVIQWRDAYYLIDYDFVNRGNYEFFVYDRIDGTCDDKTLENEIMNVLDIGVAESAGSISLGDVYNKVSVVANMNVISILCPDIMDDEDLVNQNADENKYYETKNTIDNEEYTCLNAYFKSKKNWNTLSPFSVEPFSGQPPLEFKRTYIDEITINNIGTVYAGSVWQKCLKYKTNEEPSQLNWDTYLTFIHSTNDWGAYIVNESFLKLNKKASSLSVLNGGYIIVNIGYILSNDYSFSPNFEGSPHRFRGDYNILFPARLRISNMYFDGEKFVNDDDYRRRSTKGYYKHIFYEHYYEAIHPIYRIKDTEGDWFYVDEFRYKLHGGDKYETKTIDGNTRWFFREMPSGKKILVEEPYYHECLLCDGFYLVTKSKDNDAMQSSKKLTNTVSWRMNMKDSDDGVAIPMPPIVMSGKIEFELLRPNCLGVGVPAHTDNGPTTNIMRAIHISELSLKYSSKKSTYNIFDIKSDDLDTVYSNKINDNNVTEMDDITLTVNSYSKDIASYSNSATKIGDNFDYIKDIYNPSNDARFVPEQILIDKLYRHYCSPKFKYQNCLNRGFGILSKIKENSLKKTMVVDCTNINYANESCLVTLIEV